VGFLDETWWSRLAQPSLHSWTERDRPWRLVEKYRDKKDPDPVALACYGLLRNDCHRVLLRFVEGRPESEMTVAFLNWVCNQLEQEGKQALLLVWDNASWHISRRVQGWIREHNITAKREGGVRIIACLLPVKSPWLNPIEPCWHHGKRAIVEPERKLSALETEERVYRHFDCPHLQPLSIAKQVA
jgi:transposase